MGISQRTVEPAPTIGEIEQAIRAERLLHERRLAELQSERHGLLDKNVAFSFGHDTLLTELDRTIGHVSFVIAS